MDLLGRRYSSKVKINYMFADSKIYLLGDNGQLAIQMMESIERQKGDGQSLNYMTKLN